METTQPQGLLAYTGAVAVSLAMCGLDFSTHPTALITPIGLLAQASIVCVWLAVAINLFIDLPDTIDLSLNNFILCLIVISSIKYRRLSATQHSL
ncbi:hypothetical protein [Dasania marina]|uniref:hypothetical protein n=1 Tax=Dasania marina TaxID=471499 RepID=UPI0030DD5445